MMNVLPLVFALLLILSVVTIEKFDQFKNAILVQQEYKVAIEKQDRRIYNQRQEALFNTSGENSYKQISFRPFIDQKLRNPKDIEKYKQIRQITADLIRILYGNATFFKEAEQRRPQLVDELLDAIQEASDKLPPKSIRRIEDIAKINLDDKDLQFVFYRMLKGTIEKDDYKSLAKECAQNEIPLPLNSDKTYFPWLTFVNFEGTEGNYGKCIIELGLAPRELLLAIFGKEEVVEEIIQRRCELTPTKPEEGANATNQFKSEFEGKQKNGIVDVLSYKLTKSDRKNRD